MRIILAAMIILSGLTSSSWAALREFSVEYKQGDTPLEGYMVYDDSIKGKRPAVLVVHEWKGLNDYAKMRARMLAQLGYLAFAADIYGKGVRPQTVAEAGAISSKFKANRALLRERVKVALDVLKAPRIVDPKKLAAIGY